MTAARPIIVLRSALPWNKDRSPWTDVNNLTGTSRTITGLDSATTYEAQVRATNSVGDSAYSPSGTGSTLLNFTVTGLDSSTTYEAKSGQQIASGDSAYSPSGTGTTLADLMPSAPTVADQESTVGATVNITLPVGTGGDAPLSYSVSATCLPVCRLPRNTCNIRFTNDRSNADRHIHRDGCRR